MMEQEGLSHAKKTGDDKKLQMVASRRKKLDDRMGLEKNAKGHRLQINRSAAAELMLCSILSESLFEISLAHPHHQPHLLPLCSTTAAQSTSSRHQAS